MISLSHAKKQNPMFLIHEVFRENGFQVEGHVLFC